MINLQMCGSTGDATNTNRDFNKIIHRETTKGDTIPADFSGLRSRSSLEGASPFRFLCGPGDFAQTLRLLDLATFCPPHPLKSGLYHMRRIPVSLASKDPSWFEDI